jgi:hypothetical protein
MESRGLARWTASNWFVVVVPALALAAALIARGGGWRAEGASLEAALIFDACVTIPALYALCYGRSQPARRTALRMLGLACLGIYLLGWLIPAGEQILLPSLKWPRSAGLAILIMIELRLVVAALRLAFRAGVTTQELTEQTGAPPLIGKLMLLEARLWKGLWRFLRRD